MSSGIIGLLAVVAVVVIGLLLLISCVKIVPQARAMVGPQPFHYHRDRKSVV